jgi:hypothetical protein
MVLVLQTRWVQELPAAAVCGVQDATSVGPVLFVRQVIS